MRQQFLSWLILVVMPYLVLIAGFLTVTGRGKRDFAGKAFKLGLEACILGVGIAAVLLGSQENETAWQLALFAVVFGFLLLVGYGLLNESDVRSTRKARLSILFSTFVFGANATIHAFVYTHSVLNSATWAISLGIVAWIVPCVILAFVVRDNKKPETNDANPSP